MKGFHGWYVLGASFVTASLLAGATFYSFQHFVTPIENEFGLARDQVYLGFIVFLLSAAFWAAIVGKTLGQLSPRKYALAGILSFGLSFYLLSIAQDPAHMLWIIFLPMGFGFTACGPFMSNALTANWFYKNRGKALGIAAISTSMGGFVVQPIISFLIAGYGWRQALVITSIGITLIALGLVLKFFIARPEKIGQYPDGADAPVQQEIVAVDPSRIVRNRDFWLIAFACGLLLGCDQALLASLKPLGENLGYSNFQATLIPTVVAGSAILGKLVIGWMADRYDKRWVFLLVCLSNILFLLTVVYSSSFFTLITVATFVGIAIGGIYPVWTSITADTFGRDHFAPAIGLMNLITVLFAIAALRFVSQSYVAHESYGPAFKLLVPVAMLAGVTMLFVRVKKKTTS